MAKFKPVTSAVNFPELEERVLKYWKDNKIFEKSVENRPATKTWTFLDGPPFITGLPHYGTLLSSIPKDLFPRYWTMKGYRVRRVWGWDCHGLPAENKVEEKLHIKRKKDIEHVLGVQKFIDECKSYVSQVSGEWEWYVDRIGRWVDFKNAYKTMDTDYMETVMWIFKQMFEKKLIYKGLRVSLYCPHDVTPISNFEVAMDLDNYKEITEPAAVFMYPVVGEPNTYFLAWSTTPWNKIATPALAVNPALIYVKVQQGNEKYILAKSTVKMLQGDYVVIEECKGKELIGKKFILHYDFYSHDPGRIIAADFVTAEEGTGIVTIAAYGEEDLGVMQKENIQIVQHVDEEGVMKPEVPKWAGKYYLDADPLVIEDLKKRGLIYRVDEYTHPVPTCWRCHTRLMYAPQDAWYVDIQSLKAKMKATNEKVHWFPAHFKYGRYLKSLENAPDWCISRSRYWGSPVPVWECKNKHLFVPGSIKELEEAAGTKITDLHKPGIDAVTVSCKVCREKATRVPEVLDSWIEAGSAPFAERHFPFNPSASSGQVKLADFFPPDFIVEYTGQIRAWFYVLHVIATAIYDSHAFKNVLVTGVILGTDGRKMSKNFNNYPDPKEMLLKYGGDALRLYLLGCPVMHGEDIRISELEYRNQVKGMLLLLWNVYNFFVTYANVDKWEVSRITYHVSSKNIMDRWILSRMNGNIKEMTKAYETYDTPVIVELAWNFMLDLSQWYVRRIRDRVGPSVDAGPDKNTAHQTLWTVLTTYCKALAPLIPFVTEEIYRNLTQEESVHLVSWPQGGKVDTALEKEMVLARQVVEKAHAIRKEKKIKVRQPLASLTAQTPVKLSDEMCRVVAGEVNVKKVMNTVGDLSVDLDVRLTPELKAEGEARELVRQIQQLRKEKGCTIDARITLTLPKDNKSLSKKLLTYIQKETLTKAITWGDTLTISIG